ncbi:MAG: hypothetical protein DDT26_02534 [Dehalococcoidia bacterium]|nr:hypothetical protein [Chloroflexota bacterium]
MIEDGCKERCVSAGIRMARAVKEKPVLVPANVTGLIRHERLRVPHSELALHVEAAGKDLIAWSVSEDGRSAHVVYADGDCCGYVEGIATEVMETALVDLSQQVLGRGKS